MQKKVKVYSTSTCPYCAMLKDFLTRSNITFENLDVGSDQAAAKEMIEKTGQMGVPVTDIEGTIIVGFDRERLKKELGI